MKRLLLVALFLLIPSTALAQDQRPMKVDDLFRLQRLADPKISPDGKTIAYTVTTVDLAGNKTSSNIWLVPVDGGQPRQLTATPKKDFHPRWSPDGKRLLFASTRSGESQLWIIDVDGGEAQQLTTIATGAGNGTWSRDGKTIAFVSAVYPEYSDKPFKESDSLNKKRIEEVEKSPVKAKVFSKLFYRHWDSYVEDKRQHLFVASFADGKAGEPRNVTPGDRDAYPTSMTFETGENFTFSPDGKFLVFTAVPEKDEAFSTNYDLCRVPVAGGTKDWECLTKANKAADSGPLFSQDGNRLVYRAQKRPGFEADKWELLSVEVKPDGSFAGEPASLTSKLDRSVDAYSFGPLGVIVFSCEEAASTSLYHVVHGKEIAGPDRIYSNQGTIGGLTVSKDFAIVATQARLTHPPEIVVAKVLGTKDHRFINVSHANDKVLNELSRPTPESVRVKVEGGEMHMWIIKPPGFDPKKKWPVAYLVHGGPQGAWEDGWSFRWNPMLWAAQGYVVVLPNPRGSTGFGQKFMEEISGDWGGKCYDDLMKGVDYLEKLPYVDKDRIAAAGASFGGYMMNWFAVNTGRFKTLITHCSVWNFESMWGTTDELWFDEYEHGGLPWDKPGEYAKFSPHKKAGNLSKFKTPMLIIHNDLDFRCPIGQGHELFSALQRLGIPSKFINFPDEGHWVLKPKNSEYWHKEVLAWLVKHCPPGGK